MERPLLASQPGKVPSSVCKLLVVGNAKCGKTSVIRRFVSDTFSGVRLLIYILYCRPLHGVGWGLPGLEWESLEG